jgi:Icc-related predicted phosphoesterase
MAGADAYAKRPSLGAVSFLKTMAKGSLRIAATADLHYAKHSRGMMQEAFTEISGNADVLGFAGICGFGGGFGRRMLNAWGEPLIKQFVQESISHAIRLEQALVKLQTDRRIVVLHYSPIRATLEGEDPEIYAFLGSSRLEEPINRFRATAVFHGHAHNGITDGKTSTGIPVYNVSAPVLNKTGKPYRIVEL